MLGLREGPHALRYCRRRFASRRSTMTPEERRREYQRAAASTFPMEMSGRDTRTAPTP